MDKRHEENTASLHPDDLPCLVRDPPEPLDQWSLRDFADIVPEARYA
jgi:hypothetical protein